MNYIFTVKYRGKASGLMQWVREKETAIWLQEEAERKKNPLYTGRGRREMSMVQEINTGLQDNF